MKFQRFESVHGFFYFDLNCDFTPQYDKGLVFYGGERAILRIIWRNKEQADYMWAEINNTYTFYLDNGGNLELDISQIIQPQARGANSGGLKIKIYGEQDTFIDEWQAVDTQRNETRCYTLAGISPEAYAAYLPPFERLNDIIQKEIGLGVFPPNIIYQDTLFGLGTKWQVFNNFYYTDYYFIGGNKDVPIGKSVDITIPQEAVVLYVGVDYHEDIVWHLKEPEACKNYVMVQWVALAGMQAKDIPDEIPADITKPLLKRAIFEVEKVTIEQENSKVLQILGNGYRNDLTQKVTLTCKISGLTAYSYAYYSDLLVSPKVNAILRKGEDINDDSTAVVVDGGKAEITNGTEFYTLRFTLKFKHYENKYIG